MAKIKLNPALAEFHGKLGDMVHRRLWGQQITSHLPDFSNRIASEKQTAQRGRFGTGMLKWKGLPVEVQARYRARAKELNMPPCGLFQKTTVHPPAVQDLDVKGYTGQIGQTIRVGAVDLVDIASVEVIVRQPGGQPLESGLAVRPVQGDPYWVYVTTTAVSDPAGITVEATAVNWPGQRASRMELVRALT